MAMICASLIIVFFIAGTIFGYVIGKNGCIQIGAVVQPAEEKKLTPEEQLANLMNYEGKKGDKVWQR